MISNSMLHFLGQFPLHHESFLLVACSLELQLDLEDKNARPLIAAMLCATRSCRQYGGNVKTNTEKRHCCSFLSFPPRKPLLRDSVTMW